MFDKLFAFLGFNTSESLVGLSQLTDTDIQPKRVQVKYSKKDLKLSDLMRGN